MLRIKSFFAAVGMCVAASSACAGTIAPLGGAAVAVSNGVFTASQTAPSSDYAISITGDFAAETLIADLTAPQNFKASAEITVDGNPFFSGSVLTGPIVPNALIGVVTSDIFPAVSLVAPTGTNDFEGTFDLSVPSFAFLPPLPVTVAQIAALGDVDFAIDVNNATQTLVEGSFVLSALIGQQDILGLGLGAPPASATFTADLVVQPVPLPATLPLALAGLGVLGGVGMRRNRRSAEVACA